MKLYSQYGQDIYCYNHFFKGQLKGTFLEIGADDGVDKSNTLFYENLGWNGVCVEPSPMRFKLLKKYRKCICENYAIYEKKKTARFMDIMGWGKGLSGIIELYDSRHLKRIDQELKHPMNKGCRIIDIECVSVNKLLGKHKMFKIDFCTIDTEGGELEILKSIDMNRFEFKIFCIENNYSSKEIRHFMISAGFEMVTKLNIDEIYKRA
ncbi:MAG: FkbM family methyltransferase [Deltaproteobacteria bacterium]|nr:FkbM family methyltransferase [Deltaproteobacteria bacterium]